MGLFLFILAITLLMLGHYFKMLRWKQFVEIYETPSEKTLMRSLSLGYLVNFCLPFRLGDLVRAIFVGRKMKNGISFSVATVIVDRYLDIIVVSIIFIVFSLFGVNDEAIQSSTMFYGSLSVFLIVLAVVSMRYSKFIKVILKKMCSIFNMRIQLNLLFFCWSFITSFKDIFRKIQKAKLLAYTVCIWGAYLSSYYTLSVFLTEEMHFSGFSSLFTILFSNGSLDMGTISIVYDMQLNSKLLLGAYLLLPLIALWGISFIPRKLRATVLTFRSMNDKKALNLLPQINEVDRLNFLEVYFSGNGREYFEKYISLNQEISIIQDYSAGSNATVMLCMDENRSFYRKYAFGEDGAKLYEQLQWLHAYEEYIPLPKIISETQGEGYCSYDMEYNSSAVSLFNYIHSRPLEKSKKIIRNSLNCLDKNLYTRMKRPADPKLISEYISSKVLNNINKIKNAKELKAIYEHPTIFINGVEYKNLKSLEEYLNEDYLYEVFKDDIYSEIHGDLTIENIICVEDSNYASSFYVIDPNTGNIHNSPNLDYAKLLQSLHGGYEFLMKTQNISVSKNHIDFLLTRSQVYNSMLSFYTNYLSEKFSKKALRSIFFHEIIHWLRLMPYKIEKNGKRALIFYAGMIMVINDVVNWFGNMGIDEAEVAVAIENDSDSVPGGAGV